MYRLYDASQHPETKPAFDLIYFLQLIGLTIMGGVVAWVNDLTKEISPLTALNLGLSVPALIKVGFERKARRASKNRKID